MQQIAFSLAGSDAYDPNEYIVSSSNELACSLLNKWPEHWGVMPYEKTLILRGPKGSGKTFLAKQWAKKSEALFIKNTHELTENIINHHQGFVIDGFDDSWDEEKMLHHFNIINESNKYLLITSTDLPRIKLPDLSSRINSTRKVVIGSIDDELMQMLIFKLFSNYSIIITVDVLQFLVKSLPRDFQEIVKSVEKLNNLALQHKRKITIPFIKQFLV